MSNKLKIKSSVKRNEGNKGERTVFSSNQSCGSFQEVLIHTNRRMIIKLVNTILKNIGESKSILQTDDLEKVYDILRYLGPTSRVSLGDFIDWEKCQNSELLELKSSYLTPNQSGKVCLINYGGFQDREDINILVFKVWNGNKKFWSEIIKQYSESDWIVDNYRLKSFSTDINWEKGILSHSTLLKNYKGDITVNEYTVDELDSLEEIYPIHYGFIKNHQVRYIDNDNSWCTSPFLFLDTIMREEDKVTNRWRNKVSLLEEFPMEKVVMVDKFSPYYSQLLQLVS